MAQGVSYLGCAGWSLPRDAQPALAPKGSHLQRYASRLNAVEINSSFHRPHSRATYERWAAAVPPGFRFSVKLPRTITHDNRLADTDPLLDQFLAQATGLGDRLGCLLVQLPPSLEFQPATATPFFNTLRQRHGGALARRIAVALRDGHEVWCIFDNTAGSAAAHNAVQLKQALDEEFR